MEFYILVDLTTYYAVYSGAHISWHELFLAGNQGNYHNLVLFMLTFLYLTDFHGDEAITFWKKN